MVEVVVQEEVLLLTQMDIIQLLVLELLDKVTLEVELLTVATTLEIQAEEEVQEVLGLEEIAVLLAQMVVSVYNIV